MTSTVAAAGSTDLGPARVPLLALGVAAVLALPLAAVIGEAATAPVVADPGAFVRWGILYTRVVHDLAAAVTIGLLVHAAYLVPETTRTNRRLIATRLAGIAAGLWALAGAAGAALTMADSIGIPLTDPAFGQQFTTFAWSYEPTRVALVTAGVAAVISLGALVANSRATMAWLSLLAVLGVLPLALAGHAAGATDHSTAVNALAVHLVGVTVWVGGLLALALLRPLLAEGSNKGSHDFAATASRYSTLAGWCFGAVALSGLQSALIRIGPLSDLGTRYGVLLLVKTAALLLLGYAGWRHRRSLLAGLRAGRAAAFLRLVVVELVVMGIAMGTAVALARSAPPVPDTAVDDPSPVFALTGYPDPGPLTGDSWLTSWTTDWLWLSLAVVAVGLYVAGVQRLRKRGDAWPLHRTVVWVLGWAVFVYATSGAPGVYGRVLFSMHMVMHMVVAMLVPLLLVPAAPILLALRALPARPDKTWGPRELVLQVVHSRLLKVFANPVVAAALFFFSLAIFYYSPLFELALRTHTGHVLMMVHFLLTGYLFTWVLIGIDPGPKKWPPLMLLVVLFATMSFHAFFGVVMTGSSTLLAPGFFELVRLPWMTNPLGNQHEAGAIAWGIGEAPTVILTLLVAVAWVRTDRAETKRKDRQADRDGDAELAAYNAHLQELKRRNERRQ
ncbi:cytochrome c oxidase assembly protein [Phycicoccus sp. Soil803]|uniref:cytochrome c oxidase assembly protein n=1 Tax=Phycicoccus sp. Soil803 TaxID=1736415 RepID=UPI00070B3010|nr:cytochrome c oxidase assembly protein [Phycicoccus sp. Soil803]KRF23425.1 cytochrome C oxidase assembly protein [Phycicoccus sp. Soil803]